MNLDKLCAEALDRINASINRSAGQHRRAIKRQTLAYLADLNKPDQPDQPAPASTQKHVGVSEEVNLWPEIIRAYAVLCAIGVVALAAAVFG